MLQIIINNKEYIIEFENNEDNRGKINNQPFEINLVKKNDSQYHLIKDNKSYNIDILHFDLEKKEVKLKINEHFFEAKIKNDLDVLLEKMGIDNKSKAVSNELYAPMPGMVLDIFVKKGEKITKGQALLVLEAMKMENNLKANQDGIVKKIHCKKKETVNKNQLLVSFE